jgi:hypothetical protein
MHTRAREARMKRWATIILMLLSMTVVLVPITRAADEKMTGRIVLHYNKTETIEVGDVPGHTLGISQQTGLIFYSTGEIAKKTTAFHFDLVKGKGTFVEYSIFTHQDGSTLIEKGRGTATPVDDGKRTAIEGTMECTGGTGRFDGFKGTGTFKGERIGDLKTGGDMYADFTMNCKKP